MEGEMDQNGERTEEPTAKRLKEAKKQGDRPFSEDLLRALFLGACLLLLWAFSFSILPHLQRLFRFEWLNSSDPVHAIKETFFPLLLPFASLFLLLFFLIFILHFLQRGFLFAFEKQKIKDSKKRGYEVFSFLLKGVLLLFLAVLFFKGLKLKSPFYFAFSATLTLIGWGMIDFLIRRRFWRERMKMTKQEVQDEQRENETSPFMKQKMKEK
jgi:flagellar biosynthesis protein FlhB